MRLKSLIKDYAERKDIPYEIAYTILMGTWKELHDCQTRMDELYLRMPGLGTFNQKYWRLDDLIDKWQKIFDKYPSPDVLETLEKLEYARDLKKQEKRNRDLHWDKRKEYERKKNQLKLKENELDRETPEGLGE